MTAISPFLDHALFAAALKAYDAAVRSFSPFPSDSMRDDLATRVMELAASGERDPIKLRDHALTCVGEPRMASAR